MSSQTRPSSPVGRSRLPIPSADQASHRFRVDVTEVALTRVGEPADHLVIESWHQGRGFERCGSRVVRYGDGHPLWRVRLQATGVGAGLGGAARGSWYGVGWA